MGREDVIRRIFDRPYGDPICEAPVTRRGIEDGCGKPAVGLVRNTWEGTDFVVPMCGYHLHMSGARHQVPLVDILAAAATAYVRRHCADADVILAALGLDVTA